MRPRIIVLLVASCAAGPRTRRSAARRWFAPDDGDLDVSLDHGDVAAWGAASRSAALAELGEALDARPSGRARDDGDDAWRASLEARYADAALRLARDAELRVAAKRVKSARALATWRGGGASRPGARLADDLAAPLARVGRCERLLGARPAGGARAESAWAAEALAAAAAVLGVDGGSVDARARRRDDARRDVAALLTAAARAKVARQSRDLDTLGLRARLRRRLCGRIFALAAVARAGLAARRSLARRGGPLRVAADATLTARSIAERRLVAPAREILDDLLLNEKKAILSDPRGLEDAERTLRTMLEAWLEDTQPQMAPDARAAAAASLDVSSVGAVLAGEVRHSVRNLINGNIVRALLIHVQFVSKETQAAMAAVDDLLAANTATIQALAGAGRERELPNVTGSDLGRVPLVSADVWTGDELSERPRSAHAVSGTRARGTLGDVETLRSRPGARALSRGLPRLRAPAARAERGRRRAVRVRQVDGAGPARDGGDAERDEAPRAPRGRRERAPRRRALRGPRVARARPHGPPRPRARALRARAAPGRERGLRRGRAARARSGRRRPRSERSSPVPKRAETRGTCDRARSLESWARRTRSPLRRAALASTARSATSSRRASPRACSTATST